VLLPPATKPERNYLAISIAPIREVEDVREVTLRVRDPYDDGWTDVDAVCGEAEIDSLGLVSTGGGIQVSPRLFAEIQDYLPDPWFRSIKVRI
jgi:hypothetical protein